MQGSDLMLEGDMMPGPELKAGTESLQLILANPHLPGSGIDLHTQHFQAGTRAFSLLLLGLKPSQVTGSLNCIQIPAAEA